MLGKRLRKRVGAVIKNVRHVSLTLVKGHARRVRDVSLILIKGHTKRSRESLRERAAPRPFSMKNRFLRPVKVPLIESLAELRMAIRCDWDLEIFTGTAKAGPGPIHSYRLLNPRPLLLQPRPSVEVIRIPYWLRFGNSVQQLTNAFKMADVLGAGTLQFVERHPFFKGERAGGFSLAWGDTPCTKPTLVGEFLHPAAFRLLLSPTELARLLSELVRPLLVAHLRQPDPRVRDDDLVLHFRAGDVFELSSPPNTSYGQPPLSYYLAAVEREHPARVWLVFEDRGNPCVEAAEAELNAQGVEVITQSGTVEADLRLLLSASRLAAGRSSFALYAACLSGRLRKAYFFDSFEIETLRNIGVEAFIGQDADGEFETKVLSNNWAGSPEQRALLLSYPAHKLRFTELPPAPSLPFRNRGKHSAGLPD